MSDLRKSSKVMLTLCDANDRKVTSSARGHIISLLHDPLGPMHGSGDQGLRPRAGLGIEEVVGGLQVTVWLCAVALGDLRASRCDPILLKRHPHPVA